MDNKLTKSQIRRHLDRITEKGRHGLVGIKISHLRQLHDATEDEFNREVFSEFMGVQGGHDGSYFLELWKNPETGNLEPVKVYEYTLESFLKGDPLRHPGETVAKGPAANEWRIFRFDRSEMKKVAKEQEVVYWKKIEKEFEVFKKHFENRMNTSGAKDMLLKSEIDVFEKLFYEEKLEVRKYGEYNALTGIELPLFVIPGSLGRIKEDKDIDTPEWVRFWSDSIDNQKILRYRQIFRSVIVNGRRDYSVVNNNGSEIDFVRVEAIWKHLQWLKECSGDNESNDLPVETDVTQQEAPKSKYYALYHWVLIEMGKENGFERDSEGRWPKTEIIEFAKNRYTPMGLKSPVRFYQEFKEIDITNRSIISKSFGTGYKDVLIQISGNRGDIIRHLTKYPN